MTFPIRTILLLAAMWLPAGAAWGQLSPYSGLMPMRYHGAWDGSFTCNRNVTVGLKLSLKVMPEGPATGRAELFQNGAAVGAFDVAGAFNTNDGSMELAPAVRPRRGETAFRLKMTRQDTRLFGNTDLQGCGYVSMSRVPGSFEAIPLMNALPEGGVIEFIPANAPAPRPIPAAQSARLQPNPPQLAAGPVFIAGRNQTFVVKPFTIYDSPLTPAQNLIANTPFYRPGDTAPARTPSALPYAGRWIPVRSDQMREGRRVEWISVSGARPVPGLAYAFPVLNAHASLYAIDGFYFATREDLEHFLARQEAGRIVEFLFTATDAAGRVSAHTIYGPLPPTSAELAYQWEETRYTADMFNVAAFNRLLGAGLMAIGTQIASTRIDIFECPPHRRNPENYRSAFIVRC